LKAKASFMYAHRRFIDLCAGCGGLSLGLLHAGWRGLFAIERDSSAFESLSFNLLQTQSTKFDWPKWLPQQAMSIESLLSRYEADLEKLRGQVDLLAGGPPCQGFSTFGLRRAHDPRNQVFRQYLKLVGIVQPRIVLMENVRGITYRFHTPANDDEAKKDKSIVYADIIKEALHDEYIVWSTVLHAKDYAVPQTRPRFILIGVRRDRCVTAADDPFIELALIRKEFLLGKGLDHGPVSARQALSDLCKANNRLETCAETPRFKQGAYGKQVSNYQKLMHGMLNGALANSHRFANHLSSTVEKFQWLQAHCRKGKKLTQEERGKYANKKHSVYILDPDEPAHTVTTLPDDILHYSEPRILSVREMARLQSFPDWFEFKGKYTTGGDRRTKECPRYTQVGNAVPPLLAEALGLALLRYLENVGNAKRFHTQLTKV
jgi:DNA (cytosine-5)-methyltransferase 1